MYYLVLTIFLAVCGFTEEQSVGKLGIVFRHDKSVETWVVKAFEWSVHENLSKFNSLDVLTSKDFSKYLLD